MFAGGRAGFNISPGGEVHSVQGLWVSGEFFNVLGIQPERGRLLSSMDDLPACGSHPVVISPSFWQRGFGGGEAVFGRKLTIEKHPFEVIRVAPANFYRVEAGRNFDIAVPLCVETLIRGEVRCL